MSNSNFGVDFNFLKTGFWATVVLAILKITNIIEISNWLVLLPLLISIGILFLIIFLIGIMTLYLVDKELINKTDDDNSDEIKSNEIDGNS